MKKALLVLTLSFLVSFAQADEPSLKQGLLICQKMATKSARLTCFDRLAAGVSVVTEEVTDKIATGKANAQAATLAAKKATQDCTAKPVDPHGSYLGRKWHLSTECDHESFLSLESHRQNYIVTSISSNTNDVTGSPSQAASSDRALQNKDVQFQISLKTQLLQDIPLVSTIPWVETSRLWAAYTQRSYWQIFDGGASRPFRETNFAPEIILSLGLNDKRPAWMPRMLNIAAIHESNGREDPYSRSWNRIYLEGGWEFGDAYTLIARPWWRVPEGGNSDNPDIDRYLGYGDLTFRWDPAHSNHSANLLLRNNLRSDNKGYAKFSYQYQLSDHLRWYMMLSTGYGESLLDYNHAQNTFGVGFAVGE